jgi:hypothetical protein
MLITHITYAIMIMVLRENKCDNLPTARGPMEDGMAKQPGYTCTPGYTMRLSIRIVADKNGTPRATYFSRGALRWLPIKVADAERFLANDQADRSAA